MLRVFITVDTEFWPRYLSNRKLKLSDDINRDIYGLTKDGEYGVPFQLKIFNLFGLKAVFFVESLCVSALGTDQLGEIVHMIQKAGHEIQLHIHTEWLSKMEQHILKNKTGRDIKNFSEDEQYLLIFEGLQNLKGCGAKNVCAFRAGNFGANLDTLRALKRNGILFDTSYTVYYLDSSWKVGNTHLLLQPKNFNGIYEFPISFFQDLPKHYRHAQLCGCSSQELEKALFYAWKENWYSFVIVLHSHELINRSGKMISPNPTVVKRLERLCRFLSVNRDKFYSCNFSEIDLAEIPIISRHDPFHSNILYTARRNVEQLLKMFF